MNNLQGKHDTCASQCLIKSRYSSSYFGIKNKKIIKKIAKSSKDLQSFIDCQVSRTAFPLLLL